MKKVLAAVLVLAVMFSCLPFGMAAEAEGETEVSPLLVKLDAKSLPRSDAGYVGNWRSDMVFDGNLGELTGVIDKDKNFYENRHQPGYVSIDLGEGNIQFLKKIKYVPRFGFAERLNGAAFEGSNISATEGYESLITLSGHAQNKTDQSLDGPNGWFTIDLSDNVTAYRYLRLMHPVTLNIAEVEYYMAAGADYVASLLASMIDKEISAPYQPGGVTITKTLPELTGEDAETYTLSYTLAADSQGAELNGNEIVYTLPTDEDITAKINVMVTSKTDAGNTKTITLPVVLKQNIDDASRVAADKAKIEAAFRAAVGDTPVVNGYLDLPTETQYGSTVTWAVSGSDTASITLADNRLTFQDRGVASKSVTLTAAVALNETNETLTIPNVTINSGLQIWYKFDSASVNENAKTIDNAGVNTAIGAATLENGAQALPELGAVYLDGGDKGTNSSHVKLPKNIVANITGDYTISFMMYKEGSNGWPFFIGNGNPSGNPWFGVLPGEEVKYSFVPTTANNNKIDINTSDKHSNAWKHVALQFSGETMTLYVDGVNKGSKAVPFLLSEKFGNQNDSAMNFLGKTGWNDPYYKGILTDFRIYSRAVSVDEVTAIAGGKPAADYADWQAVAQCKNAINIEKTTDVVKNITLPTVPAGNGSAITWATSNASIVSDTGVIKTNATGGETATLTATITKGGATATKSFTITLGKGGNDEDFAAAGLAWLNGYDFAGNTTDAEDLILITLPKKTSNDSVIAWVYAGKGVGVEGSALTDMGDTVQLRVQKSAFAAINETLSATVTYGTATKNFTKSITAEQMNQISIPACADAHSGTAKVETKTGELTNYLLTTKNGQIYFKFDLAGLKADLQSHNKKIIKAELKYHHVVGSAPRPVVIREVAGGWQHGTHFGAINSDGTPIPEANRVAEPSVVEVASVGNTPKQKDWAQFDITYAFLNGFESNDGTYCLALTNYATNEKDWPLNNSGAASIEHADSSRWTRLILTIADDTADMPAAYTELNKAAYDIGTLFADKTLAVGTPTQLPTASVTVPNPDYVAPTAETGEEGGDTPEVPEFITRTAGWYAAYNAVIDRNNLFITDAGEDVIIAQQLEGYTKCFTLSHENFVEYQYQKTDVQGGITLTRADNAGDGCVYIAVYDSQNQLVSAECKNLKNDDITWTNNTCTVNIPAAQAGQTVKYFLWSDELVPYL